MIDNYQAQLNQVGWSLCTISLIVTAGRCYCRLLVLRKWGLDDSFMLVAMASALTCVALVSAGVHHGYGMHLADIKDPYHLEQALKYTYIAPSISVVSSTAGKISMVLFLLRLLGTSAKRSHRWFLFSVTGIMTALNIFVIGILLGHCSPMEKSWNPQLTEGTCLPSEFLDIGGRAQSIYNGIMDIVTAGFPVYMVWKLQMKTSTKWGLSALMGGGVFAAAATFVKVYYMRDLTKLTDVTYTWGPISIWYMAEMFVLIITGSLPTLKPLWSRIRGKLLSGNNYVGGSNDNEYFNSSHPYANSSSGDASGSKTLKGFASRRPGSVTIALNEIDNLTRRDTGSSAESILPNDTDMQGKSEQLSTTASFKSSPPPSLKFQVSNPHRGIQRNISISYADKTPGTEDHKSKDHGFP